jgi:hypothetical protein
MCTIFSKEICKRIDVFGIIENCFEIFQILILPEINTLTT